jgi:prevent-host-death family protein
MREINVTELRSRLPQYLRQVQKGEELRITSRGKVIARITRKGSGLGNNPFKCFI